MESLMRTLEERREILLKRGSELAGVTRDRGLEALGRVRSGALDWHETLNAWRSELEARDTRWGRLVGLQVRVLGRFDQALLQFGERVRAEIERLSQLELTTSAQRIAAGGPVEANPVEAKPVEPKPVEPKPAKKPAARASTSGASSREDASKPKRAAAAKSAAAKSAAAKSAAAKSATKHEAAKSSATRPAAKAKAEKSRPAAKAKAKSTAKAAEAKAGKTKTEDAKARAAATKTEAPSNGARTRRPSTRLVMPIADYDDLTAKEILTELPRLTDAQCRTVLTHEQDHKARKTVIKALQSRASS